MATPKPGHETLTNLTFDIVISHLSHNRLGADELPVLIQRVYETLAGLGASTVEEAALTPAVSIRASVKPDYVTCLEGGKQMSMLKRHLVTEHDLTPDAYRKRWGLSPVHPLVAPNYAARRSVLAQEIGLGSRRKGAGSAAPRGHAENDASAFSFGAEKAPDAAPTAAPAAADETAVSHG